MILQCPSGFWSGLVKLKRTLQSTLHKFFAKEQVRELGRVWRDSQGQADSLIGKTSEKEGGFAVAEKNLERGKEGIGR